MIFVFGSNLAGIHGAGAAKYAREHHGAVMGVGFGAMNTCYGIPTKDHQIKTMPLGRISSAISDFIEYAKDHPELQFKVTRIGCGLAGYTDEQIAPMFINAPSNCYFDRGWKWLFDAHNVTKKYW